MPQDLQPGETLGPPPGAGLQEGETLGPPPGDRDGAGAPAAPQPPSLMGRVIGAALNNPIAEGMVGVGQGALETVGGLAESGSNLISKLPFGNKPLTKPLAPNLAQDLTRATTPTTPAMEIGKLGEAGLEWMAGDAEFDALARYAKVAKNAPWLLELAEKYPTLAKLFFGAAKGAAVGGAQAAAKAPAEGKDVSKATVAGAEGGAAGGALAEGIEGAAESKLARGLINRSVGATARDVVYGNPAKALLDEGINAAATGDVEAYKSALRAGRTPQEAAQAAGGRIAAVNARINEIKPELDSALAASKAKISVNDTLIKPLVQAQVDISNNRALTQTEKDLAVNKLDELKTSLTQGLNKYITPDEANLIKQQIGDRVSWGGTSAVGDEVKPLYRYLYGSLKQAVHTAVPEASALDERLTNLMAAWGDLNPAKGTSLGVKEEVGAGKGVASGNFWDIPQRLLDELGRILPVIHSAAGSRIARAAAGVAGEKAATEGTDVSVPDQVPLIGGRNMLHTEGVASLPPGYITFTASDGTLHSIPGEGLAQARQIDPGLVVHGQ